MGVSRELSQRQNTAARYFGKLNRFFLAARLKGPSRVVESRKEAVPSSSLSVLSDKAYFGQILSLRLQNFTVRYTQ